MACYNIVMATYFAGKVPLFSDILESDATLNPDAVARQLDSTPTIGAVLIVHLYGHPARTEEIIRICKSYDVVPIEDQAQAMGGHYSTGEPLGALGDISIISFGHTKILDVGGGGAFLTDDPALYHQAAEKALLLPKRLEEAAELERAYREIYYGIWRAGLLDRRFFTLFDDLPMKFKDTFLFSDTNSNDSRIEKALGNFESELAGRRTIADLYRSELSSIEGLKLFSPTSENVPWRFTFRLDPQIRDIVFNQVRQEGFDISGWYPCFVEWTPSGRKQGTASFPVACRLGKEVVNLWVAEGYTTKKALAAARSLKEAIKLSYRRLKQKR